MALLLTEAEAGSVLDLEKAIALTEEVFGEYGRGEVEVHSPYHLFVGNGAFRFVSAALKESRRAGVRCGPTHVRSGNLAVLFDTDGALLSVMGYPFATLRTAATVAVSLKRMPRADAGSIGLVGTGNNALGMLQGAKAVRALGDIVVYSRDADHRRRFCDDAVRALGLAVRPVGTLREAVSGRDIVVTATNFRQPLFPFAWLDKGTHLSSMGPMTELDPDILLGADRLVVGSKIQEQNYFIKTPPSPLLTLTEAGKLAWDDVAELGDIILGRRAARESPGEITVFHESQGGFGDVVFAGWVYNEARRRGLGREFAF